MRKHILAGVLALLCISTFIAQDIIICPSDVTVSLFDLDLTYSSYGEPTVNDPNATVDKSFTVVENLCQGDYIITTTITYVAYDENGSAVSCDQTVSVERASLDEVLLPDDYEISSGDLEDLAPEYAGQPEPADKLQLSAIGYTYDDDIITGGPSVKVIRNWTLIDWCTADLLEHTQLLRILEGSVSVSGDFSITKCDEEISVEGVTVTTDATGYTLDVSGCGDQSQSILEYVNCVAANNDVPAGSNFIIDIQSGDAPLNGVSTLDIVLIQRHILGIEPFQDPAKLIASDVTNDTNITALDLVEVRKLILGIYDDLPRSPSWKYFNSSVSVNDWVINSDTDLKFSKEEFPLQSLEIIGVKIGDVNCSAR